MAFVIKQHDLRPYITGQITQSDNTPLNLTAATAVSMILRKAGEAAPLFKKAVTLTNASQGEWEYSWDDGDTDTPGSYEMEIEIMWGSEPQTVPVDSYYPVTIVDDLDVTQ